MRPRPRASFVAVAGLSARMLAQSARRAGFRVAALDLFGDRDTRQAAELWLGVGSDAHLTISRERVADALARVARLPHMLGWIGTSGLEPLLRELGEMPNLPRWLGNGTAATQAVRDPRRFFAMLDALGIAHPPVTLAQPADPRGWLYKHADGCGGTHIVEAARAAETAEISLSQSPAGGYYQRRANGRSMSALFVAARGGVSLLGCAEQHCVAIGPYPYVHVGAAGPVRLPAPLARTLDRALAGIVASTGLVGLNSIDFLCDGDTLQVLEINARPSATMALYEAADPLAWPRGLLACHVEACTRGTLPPPGRADPPRHAAQRVLFAEAPFVASAAFSDACMREPCCRDVPMPGTRIESGHPVCTLFATATTVDAACAELARARLRVEHLIETCHDSDHVPIH